MKQPPQSPLGSRVPLDADVLEGFMQGFLVSRLDNSAPIASFHRQCWRKVTSSHPKVAIAAPRGHAKAQPLDTPVLTPRGWSTIGALREGDFVIGSNGKATRVVKLHPIEEMPLYEVHTRDGRSVRCNEEHLWTVTVPSNTKDRLVTKSLRELMTIYKTERLDKRSGVEGTEYRCWLPLVQPVRFTSKEFPIDPYVLGAWLGDGTSAGGTITSADPEMFEGFPARHTTRKVKAKYRYRIEGLEKLLRLHGLQNNKHIPAAYFEGAVLQRLALLQGLMDTDGTVHCDGKIAYFCNTNWSLIDGVVQLVRSLGGIAVINENVTMCNGKKFDSWRVSVKLPDGLNPFQLPRKARAWVYPAKPLKTAIVSIERVPSADARCITVAAKDGLYVTKDFILTHNSTAITFAYTLAACLFGECSFPVIFSKTYTIAVEFLRTIAMELQDNDLLASTFGFAKIEKDSENDKIFTFENGYKFRIMVAGMDQPVRGLKWGSRRPDLMLLDDIEDDEEVLNDERREKLLNKLLQAIIPAGSPKTKYRMVGTVLHRASALEIILKSSTWDTLRFEACDEECSPESILWPEMYDQAALLAIRKSFIEQGKLDKFNMEYRNSPTDRSAALFKESDLLPITPADRERLADNPYPRIAGGDFAISVKTRRDYTVFMVAALGPQNWTYIVDVVRARLDSEGIVTTMFELEEKHRLHTANNPMQWFVEDGAIFKALRFSLDTEMMQRNVFLNLTPMNPGTTDKRTRSMPFRARVAARKVKFDHEAPWWPALREELLDFDRGMNDDQVDAGSWLGIGLSQLAAAPSDMEEDEMQRREDEFFARHERRERRSINRNQVTGYIRNDHFEKMSRLQERKAIERFYEEPRLQGWHRYVVPGVQP